MTRTPENDRPKAEDVAAERFNKPRPLEGKGLNCAWFLMCLNDAVRYRRHPITGLTPICARCDDLAERSGIREATE